MRFTVFDHFFKVKPWVICKMTLALPSPRRIHGSTHYVLQTIFWWNANLGDAMQKVSQQSSIHTHEWWRESWHPTGKYRTKVCPFRERQKQMIGKYSKNHALGLAKHYRMWFWCHCLGGLQRWVEVMALQLLHEHTAHRSVWLNQELPHGNEYKSKYGTALGKFKDLPIAYIV